MIPHWIECRSELGDWLRHPDRLLIGCDFDGTLTPLVNRAEDASLPDETRTALRRLHALPGVAVAVISGRRLDDIIERVGIDGICYAGNHGLEMQGPHGRSLAPRADTGTKQLTGVLARLREHIDSAPGAWIEDKGLTASVHYRLAPEESWPRLESLIRESIREAYDLVLRAGKCIWELRPAVDWHKGAALRALMNDCSVPDGRAMFVGDDITDYDAFKSIPEGWAVIVGEADTALAKVRVTGPADTSAMLAWMADVRETLETTRP